MKRLPPSPRTRLREHDLLFCIRVFDKLVIPPAAVCGLELDDHLRFQRLFDDDAIVHVVRLVIGAPFVDDLAGARDENAERNGHATSVRAASDKGHAAPS